MRMHIHAKILVPMEDNYLCYAHRIRASRHRIRVIHRAGFILPFGSALRLPPKAGCRRKTSGSEERDSP